jgi:hypothetical protein
VATPALLLPHASSQQKSHGDLDTMPFIRELGSIHSATKSARISDYVALLFSKSTTYSDSSISHLLIHLELSLLLKISFSSWLVSTSIMWGLKIMLKLLGTHDDCIADLLYFRVIFLGSCQSLRHKIHWELLLHNFAISCDFFLND